jgi:peptide/nickel transport system ATP-binding protein
MAQAVLAIDGLTVALPPGGDRPHAVEGLSLAIRAGETLCIVGESGSGKSMAAHAVMGLLPAAVRPVAGSIHLGNRDLLGLSPEAMRGVRGREIGMIFQEPMTSLNPVMRVDRQIDEMFEAHGLLAGRERKARVLALLEEVGLPDPARIARAFPHELSGGQRQRVMIAMALALEPKLLIADEPTTALDVTTQAQILSLIDGLRRAHGTAVMFITHDFGVVADIADHIAVLQEGRCVEQGPAAQVLGQPRHDYTRRLLAAVPALTPPGREPPAEQAAALSVSGLNKTYRKGSGWFGAARQVTAAKAVAFQIRPGETLGLVGESGSGKSTVARCCLRLIEPDAGDIRIGDLTLSGLSQRQLRPHRKRIQMVFQDPYASLNPRQTVGQIITQGPRAQGEPRAKALARAEALLERVGLPPQAIERYPHEFSGGQRQRIGIARALALEPEVLIADEPVSALDVSVQAQILDLIRELQAKLGLAILFVTHDLRVAAQLCHRVAVMQRGEVVELGETAALFASPQHAYTRQLLAAVPGRRFFRAPDHA